MQIRSAPAGPIAIGWPSWQTCAASRRSALAAAAGSRSDRSSRSQRQARRAASSLSGRLPSSSGLSSRNGKDRRGAVALRRLDRLEQGRARQRRADRRAELAHDPCAQLRRHRLQRRHLEARGVPAQQEPEVRALRQGRGQRAPRRPAIRARRSTGRSRAGSGGTSPIAAASRAGTSSAPANGGPMAYLEPVISTIQPRSR